MRVRRDLGYRMFQVQKYVEQAMLADGRAPSYGMIRDELGIEKSNVGKIVKRLEQRGIFSRVGSGRVRRIQLRA